MFDYFVGDQLVVAVGPATTPTTAKVTYSSSGCEGFSRFSMKKGRWFFVAGDGSGWARVPWFRLLYNLDPQTIAYCASVTVVLALLKLRSWCSFATRYGAFCVEGCSTTWIR